MDPKSSSFLTSWRKPRQAPTSNKNKLDITAIADLIKDGKAKSIIVMTGAGISTAAGIPDFRTPGTGLYDNLQKYKLPYPEAIFSIKYFYKNPEPFYALAKELYPGKFFPTKTHYFILLLHSKNILLRNFTQNIDTLERIAGIPEDILVEAHGSFASAKCVICHKKADDALVKDAILQSKIPYCVHCNELVKPEITFFGESLPLRFLKRQNEDFKRADLLIILGTSLKVQPFASLVKHVRTGVPRLLINNEVAGMGGQLTNHNDLIWLGDCDAKVEQLCELLGWREELDALYAAGHAELRKQWSIKKSVGREAAVPEKDERAGEEDSKSVGDMEKLTEALAKTTLLAEGRESLAKGITNRRE